jgi:hypothetical protein
MFVLNRLHRMLIYTALLLACVGVVGCQPSQPQCCNIIYGLLSPTDLSGDWKLSNDVTQTIMDSTMKIDRYADMTTTDHAKQYLVGSSGFSVAAIHDLRRYEPSAPTLAEMNLNAFQDAKGGALFDPNVISVGDTSQAWCQASDPANPDKSVTVCAIEVRYDHFISIMYFAFSRLALNNDVQSVVNQALSATDKRIQEIELTLK